MKTVEQAMIQPNARNINITPVHVWINMISKTYLKVSIVLPIILGFKNKHDGIDFSIKKIYLFLYLHHKT